MSMPGDVTFVQLIGTWLDGAGNPAFPPPASGLLSRVVVTPLLPTRLEDLNSNITIMPQRQTFYLDSTGSLPVSPPCQVIANNCPALAGVGGFQYGLAVILYDSQGNQLAPYTSLLTAQTGTAPINISAPQFSVTGNSVGNPSA